MAAKGGLDSGNMAEAYAVLAVLAVRTRVG